MARTCELCGRKTETGNQVTRRGLAKAKGGVGRRITSRTRRTFKANVQKVRGKIGGVVRRVKACTRCLKAGKVPKPPRKAARSA